MNRTSGRLFVGALILGLAITGCNAVSSTDDAHVSVRITDLPFPFDDADSANVVIERVELVGGPDSSTVVVLLDSLIGFNLLDLRNGVSADLAEATVPVNDYTQLRVIVSEDASVVLSDGRVFPLKVPSGSQTGIKLNLTPLNLEEGSEADILVDFNVEESFVVQGNPSTSAGINGFIFKPVLKVDSVYVDGSSIAQE